MNHIDPLTLTPTMNTARSYDAAVRQIERHRGPAIVTSLDSVLFERTRVARAKRGDVLLYDPFELSGAATHGWSPLERSRTWQGALSTAWSFALAGRADQRGIEDTDFWAVVANQQLAPLLYAAAIDGRQIDDVVGWAYGLKRREVEDILHRHNASTENLARRLDAAAALEELRLFEVHAERSRTAAEATVQALLRAFRFTRIARSTHRSEITCERLLAGVNTVYVVGDNKAAKLLRPLMTALLADVTSTPADSRRPLLLAEASVKPGTIDAIRAGNLVRDGKLRHLGVPDRRALAPAPRPRGRRIHLRNPITLS